MKTIAFYSYKGGAGRSLLLLNYAKYLAYCGHSVFIMDCDLEAPGLHHKIFDNEIDLKPAWEKWKTNHKDSSGVVDYILYHQENGEHPDVDQYVFSFQFKNTNTACYFMPAGDASLNQYASRVLKIDWKEYFPPPGSSSEIFVGHKFFSDLKRKIADRYNKPTDFLLIDSRTGITDIGNEVLGNLPDVAVCLFLCSSENFEGTRKILNAFNSLNNAGKYKKVVPVLARIPNNLNDETVAHQQAKSELGEVLNGRAILTLHEELSLHVAEELRFGCNKALRESILLCDYLKLFRTLDKATSQQSKYSSLEDSYLDNDDLAGTGVNHDLNIPFLIETIIERGVLYHAGKYPGNTTQEIYDKRTKDKDLGYGYTDGPSYKDFASLVLRNLLGKISRGITSFKKNEIPIPESDINWDLLGLQIGTKFDFCSELYYLTKYRALYLDVVRLGSIRTFTCFVKKESAVYNAISHVATNLNFEQTVSVAKTALKKKFMVCLMGESAAADVAAKEISRYVSGDSLTFRKDAEGLWEWLKQDTDMRLIVCDHSVARKLLSLVEEASEYATYVSRYEDCDTNKDEKLLFNCEDIPVGFLYPKNDSDWRYLINEAVADAVLTNPEIWNPLTMDMLKAGIKPLCFDDLVKHLVRGKNPDHAQQWLRDLDVKINSLKMEANL